MLDDIHGNLKLFGFEGFVQGEVFTIQEGNCIIVGKSQSCDICLASLSNYKAIDPDGKKIDQYLKSIANEHLRITYNSSDDLIFENLSEKSCYLNNRLMPDKTIISDIFQTNYILTFGTTETFQILWNQLIFRKKLKIIELPEDEIPPDGAIEIANS